MSVMTVVLAVITTCFFSTVAIALLTVRKIRTLHCLLAAAIHDCMHDSLTGLRNRDCFYEQSALILGDASTPVAVAIIDLDAFKPINDTHGHAIGDRVLMEVAHRLDVLISPLGVVARLGGDEFALCMAMPASYEDPHALLEAILLHVARQINEPIVIDGIEMMVTASIGGVIRTPGEQASLRRLLHSADKAMYRAKQVEDGVAIGDIQRQSESTQRHESPDSLSISPAAPIA